MRQTALRYGSRAVLPYALSLALAGGCSTETDSKSNPAIEARGGDPDAAGASGEHASGAGGGAAGRDEASGSGGSGGRAPTGTAGQSGGGGDRAMPRQDAGMGGALSVTGVEPQARTVTAAVDAPIVIHFDRAVDRATVTPQTLWAFGRWSGPVRDGGYEFSDGDSTVTLTPARAWTAGDRVTVVLSNNLKAADGTSLRQEGHSFQFTTATAPAPLVFTELQRMSTRSESDSRVQTYGGSATDLNADGYLDLLIINEISADLRIFMNKADGTGFAAFREDTIVPLGERASPSDTTDFNGDGLVDVVVANLNANSLSILFGNGDGTLTKSRDVRVGGEPRGVVAIDVDGDGDVDVVNTNADGDNMSALTNDGTGSFAELGDNSFFDAGHGVEMVNREFGLASADMNEDGIVDLAIGAHGRSQMGMGLAINAGAGDGTFSLASMQAPETRGWQVAVGDMNGDGHEDVVSADGTLDNTSPDSITVVLGDGQGSASVHQRYTQNIAQPFAVDLGDLDGDGDLDVVASSYGADWEILENDGAGTVSFAQHVDAPEAGSCALLLDIDNDRDLDLALIDEIDDVLIVLRQ